MKRPAVQMNIPLRQRHSPCVGVCKIDDDAGLCLGCARTRAEIAAWPLLAEPAKNEVWVKLPARLASLSIRVRLLPWTVDEIREWVVATILGRRGKWVTGMLGALAEFPCGEGCTVSTQVNEDKIIGRACDALLQLRMHGRLRAFAFGEDGPVVLGLPKGHLTLPIAHMFTPLGEDRGSINPAHGDQMLFDFGLGRRCSRFCIRGGSDDLVGKLQAASGRAWSAVMAELGKAVIAESPARVVESELARIEVFSPIPPPNGKSPAGAHTHFLLQYLASGEEIPPALTLPDYAAPVAIFYPGIPPA